MGYLPYQLVSRISSINRMIPLIVKGIGFLRGTPRIRIPKNEQFTISTETFSRQKNETNNMIRKTQMEQCEQQNPPVT